MTKNIKKTISYFKRNGFSKTCFQICEKLRDNQREASYMEDRKAVLPNAAVLKEQEETVFSFMPVISILVPAFETSEDFLRAMIDSVLLQSYEKFELCIADASPNNEVSNVIAEYDDERIHYQHLKKNEGISGNTNYALKMATGDFVALLDHDDYLEPDALFYIVKEINQGAKCIYTDEDKIDAKGEIFFSPHRKLDFNLDLLLSNNYICHFFAVHREIALKTGGFRKEFDGAQDYDFILRCIEQMESSDIHHVDRVLYHWRAHPDSTADNPESKRYAYDAGKRVLLEYLSRNRLKGIVHHTEHLGFYRIQYENKEVVYEGDSFRQTVNLIQPDLKVITEDYQNIMRGYFSRQEVGAVGGRVIGKNRHTLSSALYTSKDGEVTDLYQGFTFFESGPMHRALLQQDADAVSADALMIRKDFEPEFLEAIQSKDQEKIMEAFRMIAKKGYLIVYDPEIIFQKK